MVLARHDFSLTEVLKLCIYQSRRVTICAKESRKALLSHTLFLQIASLADERDAKSKKYQAQLDNFQSVNEKIQWVVIDGKAQMTGIYFVLRNKDGNFEKPMAPTFMLNAIYQNREGISGVHTSFLKEIWFLQLGGQQR